MATINGTANDDSLFITAGASNDTLLGLEGNDSLDALSGAGNNILRGGDGNDELFAFTGDQLFGDAGDDTLSSDGNGNNTLNGGDGNDRIFAAPTDIVDGGAGNDDIYTEKGGATVTGGSGADRFFIAIVDLPNDPSIINNFSPLEDKIVVDSLTGVTKFSDLVITQTGADSTIRSSGEELAILRNTAIASLNANNVILDADLIVPNTPQAPTVNTNTFTFGIDENLFKNTFVGKVIANDVNAGDQLTFTIVSGNDNGSGKIPFAIDSATGEIRVLDASGLDFEKKSSFTLKIRVSDQTNLSTEVDFTVKLKNLVESNPTVNKLTNYDFTNLPSLGTTSKGQEIFLGGFSGLYFQGIAANGNLQFVTITDRGPNGEPTGQNRPFLLPTFQPKVINFELNQATGNLAITKQTGLFRADGTTALTGLPNLQAGASGIAYTDEIGVNLDGNALINDPFGIDSEGIVIDTTGNYWIVDEYRPAIYQFDVNGKLLDRFIPIGTATAPATFTGGTDTNFAAGTFGTEVLPAVYAQRRSNRGFEAVALEGNKLYAFIQSPIDNPDSTGDTTSRASRNLRILEFDIVTKAVTGEYLYLLDNVTASGNARTDKIGDAVSLGNKKFAVVERDDLSTTESNKLIYQIDLANATNINNLAVTFPAGKTTIEQLTESELLAANIKPVSKNLIVNAAKSGYTGVEKLEGLALVGPNTLALINDNDFNITGLTPTERLGILEIANSVPVPIFKKVGTADVFSISSDVNKPAPTLSIKVKGASQVSELGIFEVDDDAGNIGLSKPTDADYAEKALGRARVIFSTIGNSPSGFGDDGFNRLLGFEKNETKLRFYAINDRDATTDSVVKNRSFNKVTFSTASILNYNELSGNINFNNLVINIQATDDILFIGTGLQDSREGEVIDLTDYNKTLFSRVTADFVVNREAAFNNFVGFYKVENERGRIKKADNTFVEVGESGYIQAAVGFARVAGIDLSVGNQSTQSFSGSFEAGSIFAPFIVINSGIGALLDGNANNDPTVYFSYLGANSDGVDHVRLLGNNTFGFEDLAGGGDFDYNDIIVRVNNLKPISVLS